MKTSFELTPDEENMNLKNGKTNACDIDHVDSLLELGHAKTSSVHVHARTSRSFLPERF